MSRAGIEEIDWSLTTWEGARREQIKRWAKLPLENIVAALEEMQEIADWLHPPDSKADASGSSNPGGKTDER